MAVEEIMRMCDLHAMVLRGEVGAPADGLPPGHPLDVLRQENVMLHELVAQLQRRGPCLAVERQSLRAGIHTLYDVDKHYLHKEYLLFPYLEKHGISGPPKVMWGKHDEIRAVLKAAIEALAVEADDAQAWQAVADLIVQPALAQVGDMLLKEDEILLPLALAKLTEIEWLPIDAQTLDFGYCLYDPPQVWQPERVAEEAVSAERGIRLPTGTFSNEELLAILNTLPSTSRSSISQ